MIDLSTLIALLTALASATSSPGPSEVPAPPPSSQTCRTPASEPTTRIEPRLDPTPIDPARAEDRGTGSTPADGSGSTTTRPAPPSRERVDEPDPAEEIRPFTPTEPSPQREPKPRDNDSSSDDDSDADARERSDRSGDSDRTSGSDKDGDSANGGDSDEGGNSDKGGDSANGEDSDKGGNSDKGGSGTRDGGDGDRSGSDRTADRSSDADRRMPEPDSDRSRAPRPEPDRSPGGGRSPGRGPRDRDCEPKSDDRSDRRPSDPDRSDPGDSGDRGADIQVPADLVDLANWYLTLPTGPKGDPDTVEGSKLIGYSSSYFEVNPERDGVVFTAPVDGATTRNSHYPRSELREMNGAEEAAWSNRSGTHTLRVTEAVTELPESKPEVVTAQIHGGDDDVMQIRLEGTTLMVQYADGGKQVTLDPDYRLGTPFDVEIVAGTESVRVAYNDQTPVELPLSGDTWYFKAGAYVQSNPEKGDTADAVGQVVIYALTVDHTS